MKKLTLFTAITFISAVVYSQTYLKVSGGGEFSTALRSDSTIWAWGFNGNGQLGTGNTDTQYSLVQIGTDTNWTDITAGAWHCLAIKHDGTLWAWGYNIVGQLGDSTTTQRNSPVQIGTGIDWKLVDAGQAHTLAIKTDSTLWAWGLNYYGQLGDSTVVDKKFPVQIGTDHDWIKISAGGGHSLALKSDSTLWAWGANSNGQLGDTTTTSQSEVPMQIGNDSDWKDISAGFEYSIAMKFDNTIWSWGFNANGQLGTGSLAQESSPVQIGNDSTWRKIAAGPSFAYGIKSDSTLWGWGYNYYGQLGTGNTDQQTTPVQIGSDAHWVMISPADGFIYSSSLYGLHTLGLKLPLDVICAAGANYTGQLGDGSTANAYEFTCNTGIIYGIQPDDNNHNHELLIFSNPSGSKITITTPQSFKNDRIILCDITGREILYTSVNDIITELDVSNIPCGVYLVKVKGKNQLVTKKVIIY